MSTVNQPKVTANEKSKGENKMLNVRAPKKPSFNLSASETHIAFLSAGNLLIMPTELKEAAKFLKKNAIVSTDELGRASIHPSVKPFIFVKGYAKDPVLNENGQVTGHTIHVLDSVEHFRRDSRTLVQRNSESMLVRDLCELKTFQIEAPDNLDRGNIVVNKVEAYENTHQLNLRVNNVTEFLTELFSNEKLGVKLPLSESERFIRNTVLNGAILDNSLEMKLYTLNSASPAQTRKGEAAFFFVGQAPRDLNAMEALLSDTRARAAAVYRRFSASFKLQVFGKVKDGKRIFKLDKDPKRLDMHGSGSKPSNVHQNLFGKMQIIKKFQFTDVIGTEREMIVLESLKPMKGGVKRRIAIVEDLYMKVEQETIVVKKPQEAEQALEGLTQEPSLVKGVFSFDKNLTDGGILVSSDVALFLKQEGHFSSATQCFQARGANGVKPFAYAVHKLREMAEVDMVLFGGSRKLDVLPSLLDGTFKLSIVQAARMEEEKPNTLVATQALLAMSTPAANLKLLNMLSTGFVHSALHSASRAKQLLNIEIAGEGKNVGEEVEESLSPVDMNPKERGIKRILQESDVALKDFVQKKALLSLMSKPLEKIRKGHVFMDDAAMKHMAFDLFLAANAVGDVIRKHDNGDEDIQMEYVDSIPVGKVVVVKYGGGLRRGKALLVRYPILKHEEVQKVETAVEFSEEAQRYYEEASELGFYQGIVIFNALDMMSEAMSGADFDGDTCLVIFNKLVVDPFHPRTMILDYFIDPESGQLEGGCPWSDPRQAPDVYEVLGEDMPEGLEVEQVVENGFRTWNLVFNETDVHQRPMAVYFVFNRMAAAHIVQTAKQSSIGRWTNILMNVEDVLLEIRQEIELAKQLGLGEKLRELETEHGHYELLAKWLVYVVRWAIDEAKHGGAFSQPLAGIIGYLEEMPVADTLKSLHESDAFFPTRLFLMEAE